MAALETVGGLVILLTLGVAIGFLHALLTEFGREVGLEKLVLTLLIFPALTVVMYLIAALVFFTRGDLTMSSLPKYFFENTLAYSSWLIACLVFWKKGKSLLSHSNAFVDRLPRWVSLMGVIICLVGMTFLLFN